MLIRGCRCNQFFGKSEGVSGITTFCLMLSQPSVNFILPEFIDIVIADDEVTEEPKRLLAHRIERVLKVFPRDLELLGLILTPRHGEPVREKVHRFAPNASDIDGLDYLHWTGH